MHQEVQYKKKMLYYLCNISIKIFKCLNARGFIAENKLEHMIIRRPAVYECYIYYTKFARGFQISLEENFFSNCVLKIFTEKENQTFLEKSAFLKR